MDQVLVRIRILPKEVGIDNSSILKSIKDSLSEETKINRIMEEPIAFGLVALIVDFLIMDQGGEMENLEKEIQSSELVSQIEVIGVSKFSSISKRKL